MIFQIHVVVLVVEGEEQAGEEHAKSEGRESKEEDEDYG